MATPAKAYAALQAKEKLVPHTITRRAVGPNDVAFKIEYCGICHTDIHLTRDELGFSVFPMVPGHEIVGHVTAVGPKVTKFKVGDAVGVGCMVDSCMKCKQCTQGDEQHCLTSASFTYSHFEQDGKTPTYGGYSDHIVVTEHFVASIPKSLDLCGAAPLLCAGITTYAPLKEAGVKAGSRVGVVGLGGLGHIAVKLAKAMGAEVTVFTTSDSKSVAAKALGADKVVLSRDEKQMAAAKGSLDFIIDTVGVSHPLHPYVETLDVGGRLHLVGVPGGEGHQGVDLKHMIMTRKRVGGSVIGGMRQTQEMLDFCAKHNIVSDVEKIDIQYVNEAYDRVLKGDVKYRFVIDMASLNK